MKSHILLFNLIGGINQHLRPAGIAKALGKDSGVHLSEACFLFDSADKAGAALRKAMPHLDPQDDCFIISTGDEVAGRFSVEIESALTAAGLSVYNIPSSASGAKRR
jgi:hypothetical protein